MILGNLGEEGGGHLNEALKSNSFAFCLVAFRLLDTRPYFGGGYKSARFLKIDLLQSSIFCKSDGLSSRA